MRPTSPHHTRSLAAQSAQTTQQTWSLLSQEHDNELPVGIGTFQYPCVIGDCKGQYSITQNVRIGES